MSRKMFESYGQLANRDVGFTELSGRYANQKEAEREIIPDIIRKLEIKANHTLLEIGCGAGNLLIPLSFIIREAHGIDHPKVIDRLHRRFPTSELKLHEGNFLDLKIVERFDRILVYSVLHCLSDHDEVRQFIDRAIELVVPGGCILFGDIPNTDKKARFLASESGRSFDNAWRSKVQDPKSGSQELLAKDEKVVVFDDISLLNELIRLRNAGHEAFVIQQTEGLPFSQTREDLLVIKQRE